MWLFREESFNLCLRLTRWLVFLQIEGAFVQGIGFFLTEEYEVDDKGEVVSNSTWTYKPPTLDNIPQKFLVEITNGAPHTNRILSSKGMEQAFCADDQ
mgnify:CR=1 FL=1